MLIIKLILGRLHQLMVMDGAQILGVLGKWNEPSTSSDVTVFARSWSLDNFGEDLIATVLNGSTFIKDISGGNRR